MFFRQYLQYHIPNATTAKTHTLSRTDAIQQVTLEKENVFETQSAHEAFKCAR